MKKILILAMFMFPTIASAQVAGDLPTSNPRAPSSGQPEQTPESRLRFLLSGYEFFPSKEDLAKVGDDKTVARLLLDLAQDPNTIPTLRLRAVDAMGYYDDDITRSFLVYSIETPTNSAPESDRRTLTLIRHHAVTSFAKSQGEEALTVLEPLLTGDDLQLRLTAISAIGKQCGQAGVARLRALKRADSNQAVQHEIRKFVQN